MARLKPAEKRLRSVMRKIAVDKALATIDLTEVVERHVVFRRFAHGLGDWVTILGGIQAWAKLHPGDRIHIVIPPDIAVLAKHHPAIEFVHTERDWNAEEVVTIDMGMPCKVREWETQEARPSVDRIRLFARIMGIDNPEIPRLYLSETEKKWAKSWIAAYVGGIENPVVLVWKTRSAYKDFPNIEELYQRLRLSTPVVILEHELPVPGISTNGLTIRQTMAIVSQAKLVVTGDTGWLHVAGAFQRPIFGIYGSQNPVTRQGPYNVPGGWISGHCPHGKQPCWENLCGSKSETMPCLKFPAEAAERMILHTLSQL